MYKCAAQARARKKKGKRLCRSVECTLMDTTRLSQRRPRRPPSRSKLSRHYPRPVAGHDPWSLSEQGRRGSKFPFSASFRSASPSPPPPSLHPPLSRSAPHTPTTRPQGMRCARWEEGGGFPHIIAHHHVTVRPASSDSSEKGSRPFPPKRPRCTPRGRSWGHLDLG